MYKNILISTIVFTNVCMMPVYPQALIGQITKQDVKTRPQVVDFETKLPVENAKVSIPSENKTDFTDKNGYFKIAPSTGGKPLILSVQKEGFRPYSLTINDGKLSGYIELQKSSPLSVTVSSDFLHLGDNSYSENSSGACLINSPCIGPVFKKNFYIGNLKPASKVYVSIGSVIGIDTIQAMKLGQNRLTSATSTPLKVFVNSIQIGELKVNGDNQKIPVPQNLLKKTSDNLLTLETGENTASDGHIDYDDVELMNLIIDIKE